MPKKHLEAPTPQARAKLRKSLGTLRQLTIQPVTRSRYDKSLQDFFNFLKETKQVLPPTAAGLDLVASDYLEALWAQGAGRTEGSNVLAALQDSQPHLKGKLPQSWRLMRTWVVHEVPNRAPPLAREFLEVMVGYSLFKGRPHFALSLLVAFFGLLRTGELLAVTARQIAVNDPKGPAVISLGLTKAGKRQGAAESVTIHVEDVCRRLYQWKSSVQGHVSLAGPAHRWRKEFNDTIQAVNLGQVDFRPYSLRRGGATHMFTNQGSFDSLLIHGRWQSAKTARIYVNQGLSVLAELNVPLTPIAKNLRSQYLQSLTRALPKLDPAPRRVQGRATWKKHHKRSKRERTGVAYRGWSPVSWVWPDQGYPLLYTLARDFGFGRVPWGCKKFWIFVVIPVLQGDNFFICLS